MKKYKKLIGLLFASFFLSANIFASSDSFKITVRMQDGEDSFTIPTIGTDYNYSVDCGLAGEPVVTDINESYGCNYNPTVDDIYQIEISGDFPRFYLNNNSDKHKLMSVDQWGTQQWTSMEEAFNGAVYLNINATDTPDLSQATSTYHMFQGAANMNHDIGDWDVSNIQEMSNMFTNAHAFNQDIGDWDVSGVVAGGMHGMFENATAFNQDIGDWDISGVVTMMEMFEGTNVKLSVSHYDNLLNSWAELSELENGITLDASNNNYCEGNVSRQKIMDDFSWAIIDAGQNCDFYIDSSVHVSIVEGENNVTTLTTSFTGADPIYSIVGGADEEFFDINTTSGFLTFISAPEYRNPQDNNSDNIYRVSIQSESGVESDIQTVRVKVESDSIASPAIIIYLLN